MKFIKDSILWVVALISAFALFGCAEVEEPGVYDPDYGHVQFKLYKEASYPGTKAAQLDYLRDVAKMKVTLRFEDNLISQTLIMNSSDDESAEFGLRSDKLKLLAGDYQVITFALYNKIDEVVYEGTPSGNHASFSVVSGGLCVHDLLADVVERGKVRFDLVKDMSDFNQNPQTKAASREYTFDEMLESTKSQYEEKIKLEKIMGVLNGNITKMNNPVLKIIPLAIKKFSFVAGSLKMKKQFSMTVSNVGKLEYDSKFNDYIDLSYVTLACDWAEKVKCGISSYKDEFIISFCSNIYEKDFENTFKSIIEELDFDYEIFGNNYSLMI